MRAVIQRVSRASVSVDAKPHANIGRGLLLLAAFENTDDLKDIDWLARKIVTMRIFADDQGLMNKSVKDVDGEILVISQFTLYASTKKGNRPSFIKSGTPDYAKQMYQQFIDHLQSIFDKTVKSGIFAADMQVDLTNDGPVTIIIDSKIRE
jgi:D-aminoacyl-tRNA deacylase